KVLGQPDFVSGTAAPVSPTALNSPNAIAIDASGNVYVADSGNSRIVVYPSSCANGCAATKVLGQADLDHGDPAVSGTRLSYPLGIAVDASGNAYVADASNSRVLMFPAGCASAG